MTSAQETKEIFVYEDQRILCTRTKGFCVMFWVKKRTLSPIEDKKQGVQSEALEPLRSGVRRLGDCQLAKAAHDTDATVPLLPTAPFLRETPAAPKHASLATPPACKP
jgi:hypothetical protein